MKSKFFNIRQIIFVFFLTGCLIKIYPENLLILSDTTSEKRFPHWGFIAGMAGATGLALIIDENVSQFMTNNQTDFWKNFCKVSDYGGEGKIVIPALLLTYGTSYLIKNEKLKLTAEASIKSVIVTGIITEAGKQIFGRARPYMDLGAFYLEPFPILKDQFKAMPSGHTSLAFALFTPFAENYSRWIYCIPVAVAFGRVYQNRHWVSDVVAGGTIGFLSGYFFSHGRRQIEIIPNGLRIWF